MNALSTSSTKSRGRPSIVDAMAISEAAIVLWHEQGFANTGWKEISDATGVSTRTLMRHFSSRAELAWLGVQPATERMAVAAPTIPTDIPLGEAVRLLIRASITRDPKIAQLGPDFFSLVTTEPEIAALAASAHNPWITEVAAFISARRPELPVVIARAIATAYQSAVFAALTEWAGSPSNTSGHSDPSKTAATSDTNIATSNPNNTAESRDAIDAIDALLTHLGSLGD